MQNRQNGRRRRGSGNNPRPMGQPMGGQGNASRLEVRVRGNANQLLDKYKVLARDAHQAGDRVAAEYYLQHADHYFRVLNDSRIRQEEMRTRRGAFDQLDDDQDQDDDGEGADRDQDMRQERGDRERGDRDRNDRGRDRQDSGERGRDRNDQGERGRDGDRDRGERADRDRGSRPPRAPDERVVRDERRERDSERPRRERVERGPVAQAAEPAPMSDGEAALAAFGGIPVVDDAVAAPLVKRRGRPRKVVTEASGEAADASGVAPVTDA